MSAGYFTRTYEVWRATEIRDGGGGFAYEWNKLDDVLGRAYPTRLTDTFAAARQQGVITWTFATLPDGPLKKGDEIRFDNRKLDVKAVSVTSSGNRIEALCEERQ